MEESENIKHLIKQQFESMRKRTIFAFWSIAIISILLLGFLIINGLKSYNGMSSGEIIIVVGLFIIIGGLLVFLRLQSKPVHYEFGELRSIEGAFQFYTSGQGQASGIRTFHYHIGNTKVVFPLGWDVYKKIDNKQNITGKVIDVKITPRKGSKPAMNYTFVVEIPELGLNIEYVKKSVCRCSRP